MKVIAVPQLAWYKTKELKLSFPDSWQIEVCNMAGYDRPALKPAQIKDAITHPIDSPRIRELARGKKNVVIIFDDLTRVTRVAGMVPAVLEELAEAGVPDDKIQFICAIGCHGAMDREDFIKKLGEDVLNRFPVYNHNPFGKCTYVGTTKTFKTRVSVNEEVMKCDLKIGIGSVVPHAMRGFGGGGKMILPGVSSFETIRSSHSLSFNPMLVDKSKPVKPIAGMGLYDENPMRFELEEAATLAGLDVIINAIVNSWGETVAVYAGSLKDAYEAAVKDAKAHYLTPVAEGKDIVIANAFAKANEAQLGTIIAFPAVRRGGDVVQIANTPGGQVTHYLSGSFGRSTWANIPSPVPVPEHVGHFIVFTEYPDLAGRDWFGKSEKNVYPNSWDEVVKLLQKSHAAGARVAVYPNSDTQYSLR
ncbi:MAG: lactate racemase domain-containing protein [Dehalococcoidales bacterium]|nr:lactate racemase domain-containing protein [Dehalococcoidales bacterium]